ncbi:MAG TPA: glycogen-binding domain-containing protein [Gemmatimonadales bacterium]|nr:glycogen-binding domain-containing protein [Gemmatimonadales bacterium]
MDRPVSGRFVLLVTLSLLALPSILAAQSVASLDGAIARISYSDSSAVTAFSLAPTYELISASHAFSAGGTVSRFSAGDWNVQGHLAGSTYLPPVAGLRPEVEGRARGTRYEGGEGSSALDGSARLHWVRRNHGLWGGVAGGRAWDGADWRGTLSAEAGGWTRAGPATVSLALSATRIGDESRYADGEAALRLERGALDLVAWGGLRRWTRPDDATVEGWGGASIAWWIGSRVALTGAAGRYVADPAQGLPSGSFGSIGLRIATGRPGRARRIVEPLDRILPRPADGAGVEITSLAGGSARLEFIGVRGSRVELMGDFTSWQPVALTPTGSARWSVTVALPPGVHRLNIRVDGGEWRVPPGLPSAGDDFGGAAGILIVE